MKRPTDPLQVLPPELIGDIFYSWLLDHIRPHTKHSHSQLPVVLCLVSKSWRDFVYGSPLLWAHIILELSRGTVTSLHALQKQLERSQGAPLFVDVEVGEQPDRHALGVLFAERRRFGQLTLRVIDLAHGARSTHSHRQAQYHLFFCAFPVLCELALDW
ncbi:hypothetical protein PAXINDRAFT_173415 [Paxillus involutus ATCC 200175]|uniref:F-box domain-containing protein n=1 Tax=Paxillus involutus ATCC 200175 TaxID=664439 RepID=A0A0C9SNA7_PAXIN|nr:hypothetical protein PAXINDRAFT_173415 [Paxillus involutus ATCC 200175]